MIGSSGITTQDLRAGWRRVRQSAMLYGSLATAIRVGANVLLLPFILKQLSGPELALWWVFVTLGLVANLTDFGFSQAITRVYSYLWAGAADFDTEGLGPPPDTCVPNSPRIRQFHRTVRYLYARLALGAMLLLSLGGTFFLLRLAAAAANPTQVWIAWAGYILAIGYNLGTSYWLAACQGVNRPREMQAAFLWSGLAYLLSAVVFLVLGWGLMAMVAATAIRGTVIRQYCRRAFGEAVPVLAGERLQPELSILKRLWPNARKFGLISVAVFLVNNANVLICSRLLGDAATASFGLTCQVGMFIANFSALWLAVKWPQITILRTRGRLEEMAALFAQRLGLVMVTFVGLAVMLVLFGNLLLDWKGSHTRLLSTSLLVVYLLHLGQQQFAVQFGSLTFTENVVPFFKLSLVTGVGLVILSWIMASTWGLWGLVLAPLISTVGCLCPYMVLRGFRGQPLSIRQFVQAVIFRPLCLSPRLP